ncbi:gamma-glutamyl-gamma-aminobutyrate hydrolase family protein [Longispora albida]|uniref:gamma-glutamyl-gamma-aminobutyrate hydrolase family protein n=1 Tax=Longispora albida TaxID=203523 RepID=UPI000476578C|nr:gamma-glutamyl-gamma-aminobutyrate hydrolase family protein [Longispora albida]
MRPVIGVTAYVEPARWLAWDTTAVVIPHSYTECVREAGGHPVVLPPDPDPAILSRLDGLVLTGGADVSPALYGAEPHPETMTRADRDAGELALLAAAGELPVLGICRGMQLMAVHTGGRLHQHLPELIGGVRHLPQRGVFGRHQARFEPGSRVHAILGAGEEINSYHHQSVADPGKLAVTGWADDGVIEALEDPGLPFHLGVQWHPEQSRDLRLFSALVTASRTR